MRIMPKACELEPLDVLKRFSTGSYIVFATDVMCELSVLWFVYGGREGSRVRVAA